VAAGESWGTFAWTVALAISYAVVVVSAPIIGAYADAHAAKKKLLAITTMVACSARHCWRSSGPATSCSRSR
jgi:UMF1 family MFS transporter